MQPARLSREHWVSLIAILILATLSFGVMMQITASIASNANGAELAVWPL